METKEDAGMPYVLIGGFSHSGTSVVTHLAYELGFSPGHPRHMKGHGRVANPYGYWENLKVKAVTYDFIESAGLPGFKYHCKRVEHEWGLKSGLKATKGWKKKIREVAGANEVEVYKGLELPIVWRIFPEESKYIMISRDSDVLWQHWKDTLPTKKDMMACWEHYQKLARQIGEEVSCLYIRYEDFRNDLRGTVRRVAEHVGRDVEKLDVDKVMGFYKSDRIDIKHHILEKEYREQTKK